MTPYETLKSSPEKYQRLTELEKLNEESSSEENRFKLATAYAELGMDAQEHQKPEEADFWCEKQLNMAESLYHEFKKEEYGILLGDASDYFALSASELNQPEDALEWIKKSIAVYGQLAKDTDRPEAWYTTALSYLSMAGLANALERTEEELDALIHAKDIMEARIAKDADSLFRSELPMVYSQLALVLRMNHRDAEANKYEEKAKAAEGQM